ncbi:MAG: extracellular solute-binding protein, partial [Alkalispirochaeta sp.]
MNQRSLIRFAGFLLVVVLVSAACTSTPADNSDALRNGVQRLFANSLDDERYRIAVLPLADYRTGETDELGRYISGDVMYQISVDHSNRVQMVEREMITQLLSELEFDIMSGMVSDSDVKQFGEMSGANHLIMGTKLEMGDEIEANLRLVEVESGEIRGVSKFQLAVDRRYAALISGDVTVAEAPPPPIEQPDNPWTDGRDLSGTTVTVLGVFDDVEAELFEASMHRFEEQTGIDVSYQVSSHFEAEVLERVEAGDAPDAVIIPQPGLAAELVDRGAVHDIREWFGSSYLAEQYNQMWRDSAEIGGIQAGVWYRASVKSIVWYNRPVFERHGYAIPETWEELLSLSDRIVADGYTPWSIA